MRFSSKAEAGSQMWAQQGCSNQSSGELIVYEDPTKFGPSGMP